MTKIKYIFIVLCCFVSTMAFAQGQRISGTVTDEMGPVIMANVTERDANNRIVSAAVTDMNGNFALAVKNNKNRLQISYTGNKTVTLAIGARTSFKVHMESATTIKEVIVRSKPRFRSGGLSIPKKEVSVATQTMNMADVEGLAFTSADEALQGKIAGLDIVSMSGNLGSSTQMRLRGVTSINGNTQPLIVVDDNIFDNPDENFDFTTANEETYAALLSVNPQDIESIDVLKDAAATAIWGSRGANGVISIKTKRGARGKTRIDYSLRLQLGWQPKGYNLLNGDDYTMLMKEEYFNPAQNSKLTENINEFNYNKEGWAAEWENWNNNTDWVKSVQQTAISQYHYLTLTGGGEKATFRVSAGYDHQQGTIIKQTLDRFSTKLVLDYLVSDRIKFSTTFPLTYTKNHKNYDDNILGRALKMAPNMSIYRQDANGNDTEDYFIMYPTTSNNDLAGTTYANERIAGSAIPGRSAVQLSSIRGLGNPVALANLAYRDEVTYRISPEFKLDYDLLGTDDDHTRLKYTGTVYLDVFSKSEPKYIPGSLNTNGWTDGDYNSSHTYDYNSLGLTTKHWLTFTPHFKNEDIFATMLARWEMTTGNNNSQELAQRLLPRGIESASAGGALKQIGASNGQWRSMSGLYSGHFSYKSRYAIDLSMRADGSTKFGGSKKWGYFPGVSARWNISDEPWMKWSSKWLSMLSFRPSWGIVGNQPGSEYLYFSKYATSGVYGNGNNQNVTYMDGLQLEDLKWERTMSYNLGGNIGFLDDMITADFNYYYKKTKDLLMRNVRIPSSTGFTNLAWSNVGDMENKGWELNIDANRFLKLGKFSMSANFNISQNFNEITAMDESVLESINGEWSADARGQYLNRIQIGNPVGSIYGLKYKGVYQYTYEYLTDMQTNNNWSAEELRNYINNTFLPAGKTAPIAIDGNGKVIMKNGEPVRQVYNFKNSENSSTYQFQGGDAIYEDINHDGQINSLDVVYLGNSNPKLNGGFGVSFYYGDWTLKTSFNYRVGFKVVNTARMSVEQMFNANNQSTAVNWRWRKNGDVTMIPRAMYDTGYNFLGSDRYVEDGSFLRFNYLQIGYNFKGKVLKQLGLSRLMLSLSGQNLFVWSKYSGTDPEHSAGAWGIAYDNSQTPRSKSFTMNINVGF